MAGKGPAPKKPGKRLRRNAEPASTSIDSASAPLKMRPLPGSKDRHPRTRRWWRAAATSPQAGLFIETDWLIMERLADLYDAFFAGTMALAGEIRLCESKLGFAPDDRLRLRWQVQEPSPGEEGGQPDVGSGGPKVDPRMKLLQGGKP